MYRKRKRIEKFISLVLSVLILLMSVGCSNSPPDASISGPEPKTITEKTEIEKEITEKEIHEYITTEVYLQEFVAVENKISELLLEEDMIEEVRLCKTIYVPQDNIEEFSENSQTSQLFGTGVNIKSLLSKIAIGTGIILTLSVVKKADVVKPIASIVATAADESLKFAEGGAVIGSVLGAFNGAANQIDEAGRASAVACFALAAAGLICSIVSFVGAIPSGGTTGWGVAEGVHLLFAAVRLLTAANMAGHTYKDLVTAIQSTDAKDIDWGNINWEKVGTSAIQSAVEGSADGYMWGSIYGLIDGTIEGYYHKYATPHTKYVDRLKKVPKEGKGGHWTGTRGESEFVLDEPIKLPDGTKITKVKYQNAVPDFSPSAIAEVKIPKMTNDRFGLGGNYEQADKSLAEYWTKTKYQKKSWTSTDVKKFRENYPCKLTWHEMSNMESMQLVPYEVNSTFGHYGGVAEYNAMLGEKGALEFD